MPAIQVRNLPQNLYDQLARAAERDHRSIAQETTFIIEEYCSRTYRKPGLPQPQTYIRLPDSAHETARQQRRSLLIRDISALPHFDVPTDFPDVPELLAEERDVR